MVEVLLDSDSGGGGGVKPHLLSLRRGEQVTPY